MQTLARFLVRFDDLVLKATLTVCGALLTVMVVVAGLGVFCRFVLHASLSWSEEFDSYLFVWLTCLGAAAGVKLRAHPEVRVIPDRVPAPLQLLMAHVADIAVAALGVVFVVYGSDMIALMGSETAASLPISMVYPYLAIPVGGGLLIWHSFVRIAVSTISPATRAALEPAGAVPEHI